MIQRWAYILGPPLYWRSLMKWLILLFTFIKPFLSTSGESKSSFNPIEDLKDMIKENAVKVMLLFMAGSILSTIFAAGIVIIAVDIGAQYDQNAYIYFSSMITMGLILVLLPIIIGAVGVKAFTNDDDDSRKKKDREELKTIGTSHPLQDALALLIHDFVKEREMKRNGETYSETASTTPSEELRSAQRTQAYDEAHNPNFPRH